MTITAISDTHGRQEELDLTKYPADVLVHAGDWTKGRDLDFQETKDFLKWYNEQPFKHKILIAGNHEVTIADHYEDFTDMLRNYPTITYLHNSSTIIDGVEFWGSPYSNKFYNWAFMADDEKLADLWDTIPDTVDVIITHGPSYGYHDMVENYYTGNQNVGSQSLTDRKAELPNVKLHISGHIHNARGISEYRGITNIGAAVLNDSYKLAYEPIVFDFKPKGTK